MPAVLILAVVCAPIGAVVGALLIDSARRFLRAIDGAGDL